MGVEKTNSNIMTEQQFNTSPLKSVMSYKDYFANALKLGSTFTFKHLYALQNAEETSERIKNSVKGWALEKEAEKNKAEEQYELALQAYEDAKKANAQNLANLQKYAEGDTNFASALKKYNLSSESLFNSDISLSVARDHFNSANFSAFRAYLSSLS